MSTSVDIGFEHEPCADLALDDGAHIVGKGLVGVPGLIVSRDGSTASTVQIKFITLHVHALARHAAPRVVCSSFRSRSLVVARERHGHSSHMGNVVLNALRCYVQSLSPASGKIGILLLLIERRHAR